MKALRGRIIIKLPREGIHEPAAGISVAHHKFRRRQSSLDAALPCHQHGLDPVIVVEPAGIHHTADIHDNDHSVKIRCDCFHHRLLRMRQVKIPVLEDLGRPPRHRILIGKQIFILGVHDTLSVPSLAGKAADRDHRSVRVCSCLLHELCRNLRFDRHTGNTALLILRLHIIAVECGELLEYAYLVFEQQKPFIQVSRIRDRHLPASASAAHIVEARLSKQGDPAPLCKRKQIPVIF